MMTSTFVNHNQKTICAAVTIITTIIIIIAYKLLHQYYMTISKDVN